MTSIIAVSIRCIVQYCLDWRVVENQHKKIKGYRDLSQKEIDLMNAIKTIANEIGSLIDEMNSVDSIDKRWLNIGKTDLQKGFMSLTRSVAKPESF